MASRYADSSRNRYDDRGRGHYTRDRDRDRDDRRRDRRDDRRDDRFEDRRGDRDSYAPSRRRSRSPVRRDRHDRSRDRYDERYRDERPRHNRERERGYDERDRDARRRDDRRDSYGDRRRGSTSMTPSADVKRNLHDKSDDHRRENKAKSESEKLQDEEAQQKAKMAKLEAWKKKRAETMKAKSQTETPVTAQSPAATAPPTPRAISTPPVREEKPEEVKANVHSNGTAEKPKQTPKPSFKIDESSRDKPLHSKAAVKPVSIVNGASMSPHPPSADHTLIAAARSIAPVKANNNIGSFGLKAKPAITETKPEKKALLDEEDTTGKRKLQALPDYVPEDGPSPQADDDAMSDIGSDDEETNAQLQAQLEKRRAEIAGQDTRMEDAPAAADESAQQMEDQDDAGTQEDVDPLDAYMAGLEETPTVKAPPQGQALFGDDNEPVMEAVEDEDLFALTAAKKKKKEIPVVDHTKITYPPFKKSFYIELKEISEMSDAEVADLKLELDGIKVRPDNVLGAKPVTKWAQMGLLSQTMDVFQEVGYSKPTSIQSAAIPLALSGADLIGVAKTGSGKTLAFGIPAIRHILDQPPLKTADGPIALILAPTRELTLQIVAELKPFLRASKLKIAAAYGGAPISDQIAMIKRGGIHCLVATPGRLIDLLQSNSGRVLNFRRTTYVVLDEADRMFDMGFEPQVTKCINQVRPDRQTILFSATFPKTLASLARKTLTNPVEVIIGGRSVVAPDVTQIITVVEPAAAEKFRQVLLRLGSLFDEDEDARALIFVERQETAEDLLLKIMKKGYPCNTIHGAKDQQDRTDAINDFKAGINPVLVATSVAARGLDVKELKLVVNYDCPSHLEDYVHRCGRTGRAGNKGVAVTLIERPGQERFAVHIVKALKQSGQEVPEELQSMASDFVEKTKTGQEKWYDPGFGGKGLDKLDAARALEKKREKRAAGVQFDDDSDSEPEAPIVAKNVVSAAPTTDTTAEDEPSWLSILKNKVVVTKTERPSTDSMKNLSAVERAKAAAMAIDGRLGKKGMIHHGQPIDNKGPDAGAFHSTVEINDFPQKARWAVTNRTNVAKILDATGTSITTKGTFYAAGKEPGEGELPKLYILVEGDTEGVVSTAVLELIRLLKEGASAAATEDSSRGPTGRYSVI